ncbi:MAG: hypothetical protein ACYC6J_07925 [Coriobacteriia bacterium]
MTFSLVAIALLGGACAWLVGHAFVAPRDSFLRSAPGGMVLAACVLLALFAPATLAGLLEARGQWPAWLSDDLYRLACAALVALGLLGGVRVWRMRLFSGDARLFRLDESPASRAEAALPLAGSLADALDVLAREKVGQRDVARLSLALRRLGARYFHQLPEKRGEVYTLVARHVGPGVAADVTGLLLEGAGRK